jgi:hypothetical protein
MTNCTPAPPRSPSSRYRRHRMPSAGGGIPRPPNLGDSAGYGDRAADRRRVKGQAPRTPGADAAACAVRAMGRSAVPRLLTSPRGSR